eukprot:CAMPEP_0172505488 /NCGR_PEP_ID=MMETSP1066-20121228/186852_1 /TAXON_ID=671091 /ORGANISM="Coscinodiscus wailesii, Strain CCMP2513" /LENGTH=1192 /DNA_ID=CAMNT_0013282109 /DNA_START=388 /DNA_END=3966 /DNA_ORIENTATION=+
MQSADKNDEETNTLTGEDLLPSSLQESMESSFSGIVTTQESSRKQRFASSGDRVHHPPSNRTYNLSHGLASVTPPRSSILVDQEMTQTGATYQNLQTTAYTGFFSAARAKPESVEEREQILGTTISRDDIDKDNQSNLRSTFTSQLHGSTLLSSSFRRQHTNQQRITQSYRPSYAPIETHRHPATLALNDQQEILVPEPSILMPRLIHEDRPLHADFSDNHVTKGQIGEVQETAESKQESQLERTDSVLQSLIISIVEVIEKTDLSTKERYYQYKIEVIVARTPNTVFVMGEGITGVRAKHVVLRNYTCFQMLHSNILSAISAHNVKTHDIPELPFELDPAAAHNREYVDQHRHELEKYLRHIVSDQAIFTATISAENRTSPILEFLDNESSSLFMHLRYASLETRLADLTQTCTALRNDQVQAEQTIADSKKIINSLQERVRSLETSRRLPRTNSENSITSMKRTENSEPKHPYRSAYERPRPVTTASSLGVYDYSISEDSVQSVESGTSVNRTAHHDLSINAQQPLVVAHRQMAVCPGTGTSEYPLEIYATKSGTGSVLRGDDGSSRGGRYQQPQQHEEKPSRLYGRWDSFQQQALDSGKKKDLPWELILSYTKTTVMDKRAEEILHLITPNQEASSHRDSVIKYLSHQIKNALDAKCFPIGAYALKTFLPDDRMEVSATISLERESIFFVKMHELLSDAKSVATLEEGVIRGKDISNVGVDNYDESNNLKCKIGGVGLGISVNNLACLCEAAFLEHFDLLLGRQHLFKRSLLLLKAWWIYESSLERGEQQQRSEAQSLLSEYALAVMLAAVVNRCHRHLHWPMQVLAAFLSTYNNFDWKAQAVSIENIIPIEFLSVQGTPKQFHHSLDYGDCLLPIEVLDQYRRNYASKSVSRSSVVEHQDYLKMPAASAANKPFPPSVSSKYGQTKNYRVGYMNIINPLNTRQNLLAAVITERNLERISQAINNGARGLRPLFHALHTLEESKETEVASSQYRNMLNALERFFTNTLQRYSGGRRPDIGGHKSVMSGTQPFANCDLLDGDYKQLWDNLQFSSFLLEYEMTTSALTNLATAVLAERGPMPVGEVGKMLQEASANPNLSQLLKEQFNGLKKFLEKFPDIFLISNDHPFNPHVYLRSGFTEEEQRMIEAGSTAFISTQKKTKKVRRKGKGNAPQQQHSAHQFNPPASPFPH